MCIISKCSVSELGEDARTVERIFTDAQIQVVVRKVRSTSVIMHTIICMYSTCVMTVVGTDTCICYVARV